MINKYIFWVILLFASLNNYSQVSPKTQLYRDDQKGDFRYRRGGTMDGNQVRTLFYNNGEVGQWPYKPSGEWPKGTGHTYLDGVAVLIAAEFTAPGNKQVIHSLETSYREWMDKDPVTGLIWGLEPIPGYMNPSNNTPAINTDSASWPKIWPAALGITSDWNTYWYGYFGKGVQNSDFETFFVMDDSKDKEFVKSPYLYQPIAADLSRGGIGLRVEVRGFQWSHVLAEDIIFWHYDIVNISDYNYPKTIFGFYTDVGIGGEKDNEDDCASFDTLISLAYCYDGDGYAKPEPWKTGYYGYAYLESPGNATDKIDNDHDVMIDERRDDGIDNDHDWVGYTDLNGNGKWDSNEPLNDDVGTDGIGPFDVGYTGPDLDNTQGNGKPDDGEPNFDRLDKDESDQIGLTAVSIYRLGDGGVGGGWPRDDESMWKKMDYHHFDTSLQRANISMVFASGTFPLNINSRERFSMALVFGNDLTDIKFNKETVQQIYNSNYNFSKPPSKPFLTAIAGDKKVYLLWDKNAETSYDRVLKRNDFEGYLIYRSEEAAFNDIKVITDSKGDAKYWKPIAQFDLKDTINGPDPVGINGARFWRGDNTGLRHSYIDTTVVNGKRYYYACVSYDMGDTKFGTTGLQPSECTKIISEDLSGVVTFTDINTAMVVPNASPAGYNSPGFSGDLKKVTNGLGSGYILPIVVNPRAVKDNASYQVTFKSDALSPKYKTLGYSIVRTDSSATLASFVDTTMIGLGRVGPLFDGITLTVFNDTAVSVDLSGTGWSVGKSNVKIAVSADLTSYSFPWPADYEISFSDSTYLTYYNYYSPIPVHFKVINLTTGKQSAVSVDDVDANNVLSLGDKIKILEFSTATSGDTTNIYAAWSISYDSALTGITNLPKNGDKYLIKTKRPFQTGDYFTFKTISEKISSDKAKETLANVGVVPNPYLGSASWERVNINSTGRGERRIDFIHLPTESTVRIYTVAGALIKTLHKDYSMTNGSLSWNLVTDDGMDAAYGLYVYHVDAPGVGTHIGKFAIIK